MGQDRSGSSDIYLVSQYNKKLDLSGLKARTRGKDITLSDEV